MYTDDGYTPRTLSVAAAVADCSGGTSSKGPAATLAAAATAAAAAAAAAAAVWPIYIIDLYAFRPAAQTRCRSSRNAGEYLHLSLGARSISCACEP